MRKSLRVDRVDRYVAITNRQPMPAISPKRTCHSRRPLSAFGGKADIAFHQQKISNGLDFRLNRPLTVIGCHQR